MRGRLLARHALAGRDMDVVRLHGRWTLRPRAPSAGSCAGSSNSDGARSIVPAVEASTSACTRAGCARAKLERGPAAHRLRHDADVGRAEVIGERREIARVVVRVGTAGRRARRREAAMREGHAGVAVAEVRHLLPPAQVIAAEPMREDQEWTRAGGLVIEATVGAVEKAANDLNCPGRRGRG